MNHDPHIQLKVEQYLNEQMSEAERLAFEKEMSENPALQEAVDDEYLVMAAMRHARKMELRELTRQWANNPIDPTPGDPPAKPPIWKRWAWLLGTALIFLALLVMWLLWPDKPVEPPEEQDTPSAHPVPSMTEKTPSSPIIESAPSPPENTRKRKLADAKKLIYSDYGYQNLSDKISNTVRGSEKEPNSNAGDKTAVLELIKKRDYDGALQRLSPLDSSDVDIKLLRAHALFESGRYNQAIPVFRSLSSSKAYGVDAQWNVLMCYFAQYPAKKSAYEQEIQRLQQSNYPSLQKKVEAWLHFVNASMQ